MKITRKDVEYVAALAHLELSAGELERLQKELDSILTYMEQLNRVDTTEVEPMAQVLYPARADVALREDQTGVCLPRADVLAAAPDATDEFVKVPKVIER
ncbi:MAG: Asp-tRNA(Asn)/Glu-tRNA(Gln) amidotransferase subunit GatC [Acidobacteria bacterium]|nr:Asp-tRNA(Asn)/Glu-tRNA(Gln) amidotransferase subunit GatC [Acidobacteriota bacterium]